MLMLGITVFAKDLLLAYPCKPGQKHELSMSLDPKELKLLNPQSSLQATSGDSSKVTITDITVGQLLALMKERPLQGEANPRIIWQGEHATTHHKISIAQRVDRALLCSVYEQSRQIASICANLFGPLPGDQPCAVENKHPPMQAACAFMLPLVRRDQ